MIIWGVDPGLSGAIVMTDTLRVTHVIDLEDFADRGRLLPKGLRLELAKHPAPYHVTLEDASTRDAQDAGATLKTGRTFGHLEGLLVGMGFEVRVVPPATWKPQMGIPAKRDKESYAKVVSLAERALPQQLVLRGPKAGLYHDRAEAALLALYGWKYQLGRDWPPGIEAVLNSHEHYGISPAQAALPEVRVLNVMKKLFE